MAWTRYLGKRFASPPYIPWRELPPRLRVLRVASLLGWSVLMISLLTDFAIENASMGQPDHPVGIYLYPDRVKEVVRYLTEWQEHILRVVQPATFASSVLAFILGGIYSNLEERLRKQRQQAVLEKFARGFDEHDEPSTGA